MQINNTILNGFKTCAMQLRNLSSNIISTKKNMVKLKEKLLFKPHSINYLNIMSFKTKLFNFG